MTVAAILIKVRPGSEARMFHLFKDMDHINGMIMVFGEYDLMAWVNVDSPEDLNELVLEYIRTHPDVIRTSTHIKVEIDDPLLIDY